MTTAEPKKRNRGIVGHPKTHSGIHDRLRLENGLAPLCIWDYSHAGRFEWANVSGIYTTNLEDYLPMCISCHRKFDITDKARQASANRLRGKPNIRRRKIAKYSFNDELVAVYDAVRLAATANHMLHTSIVNNLAGRAKSAGGFVWRYYV